MAITELTCQRGCGACCIAPQISSPIPGMPDGKPAGVRCVQLDNNNDCKLFGKPDRPDVCEQFLPEPGICDHGPEAAMRWLSNLERETQRN